MHFSHHSGSEIVLNDGTEIRKGDRIGEIHFNNSRLIAALGDGKWTALSLLRQELHALALWTTQPDFPANLHAVFGNTILWRGAVRLGFTVGRQPVTIHRRLDRLFLVGLLALYSSEGMDRLQLGKAGSDYPQQCWLSRGELLFRYREEPV
jgi:peptidoglycan-N-acetylglucosamine deacetylase